MTNQTKDAVVLQIADVIGPLLEPPGFVRRRHRFEASDDRGNIRGYEICLSRSKSHFSLHLRLTLSNPALMERVNAVLKQVLLDVDAVYPANWDAATVGKAIPARTRDTTLAMLTDRRCFKAANESLEAFRTRFSIWMCVFDTVEEVQGWQAQLMRSVGFADAWFRAWDRSSGSSTTPRIRRCICCTRRGGMPSWNASTKRCCPTADRRTKWRCSSSI
ncbi:hypothetical protein [Xanthomonas sacchari]|uniref:hypothetical protein n=1 Tax=Xanthomonas sacchari TaxID=56458 RepID=UPI0012E042F3|nr:hypothetical protein [Xanthomonas sacchari]